MENPTTPPPVTPQNINQQFNQQFGQQILPNSTAVLVLGIISIPVCFCYFLFGVPGLALSIISLVLSNKATKEYNENPSLYTVASFNNMKAGRICAIVGMCLNVLCLLGMLAYIIFFVSLFSGLGSTFPWK